MKKLLSILGLILLVLEFSPNYAFSAAGGGSLKGTVKDAQTGDILPFANVIVKGTSLGCAADKEGNYSMTNIPVGSYTILAKYIGYVEQEIKVDIKEGKAVVQNFSLKPEGIVGETIVVTGQASGQLQAINEQLNSIAIKNVVSLAKIQELPDANAAESVGRLPGVSLMREGGEGSKVVIRGLSPQYNQVTIDGVEMGSNVASGNNLTSNDWDKNLSAANNVDDRGTDLSMVSSSMLGGIEVIKAITPDMDAGVLGGVVNFDMRKASKSEDGRSVYLPKFEFMTQGGYNGLKKERNDYKFVASMEKRFNDNAFGIFAQGTAEQRNLSSNSLNANYVLSQKHYYYDNPDLYEPDLTQLSMGDTYRMRKRYNATVVLDYHHETGDIGLMNFYSNSDTKEDSRSETGHIGQPNLQLYYNMSASDAKLNMVTNLLSIKQTLPIFQVSLKLSHSYAQTKQPEDMSFDFVQDKANIGELSVQQLPPQQIASMIKTDAATAYLFDVSSSRTASSERSYTGSLDLQSDITASDFITAKIKFGANYQYRNRYYNYDLYSGSAYYDGGNAIVDAFRSQYPSLHVNTYGFTLDNFIYDGYSYGEFLSGDYSLAYPLNVDFMKQLMPIAESKAASMKGGAFQLNKIASQGNDYWGNEKKSAAYVMATIDLGEQISILPGVRYQNLTTEYTAMRGEEVPGGIKGGMYTTTKSHGYFLPMVHLRYKPFPWLQTQLAYTNTLNYPAYSTITPRYYIGSSFISYNNVDLKPARSENIDLVMSVYNNEIGLLTVDGFYKKIKDLIFFSLTYPDNLSAYPDLPQDRNIRYGIETYVNNPNISTVKGIEVDWQTHFWYLPAPLSGLVFNINYTHVFSEARYPKQEKYNVVIDSTTGETALQTIDRSYVTRLVNQPNDVLNLGLGFDYAGFSARVSMLYKDNIFKNPSFWMQERTNSDKYTRWDLSLKQDLPYGLQVYFDLLNISGEDDVDLNQKRTWPSGISRYGMAGDVGLRIKL
ncbi:MAG: TonB-dependent receptor [Bacteroidota bacterium]|nr:TonB-dependent receptor [Bacteroidota bacterium]MDP4195547.1 TonB-dependent receptor [Bacteroidota bacterium]